MKSLFSSLLVVLTLAACAYPPQQVTIAPEVSSENVYGKGQNVAVSVNDLRASPEIGNRSADAEHDSPITPADNYLANIEATTRAALMAHGFNSDPSLQADAELIINITELSYENIASNSHLHNIKLQAELTSEVKKGGKFYKGRYQTSVDHELGISPSAAKNESVINDVLSKSLQSLLNDPKAQAFLIQE